VKIITANDGRQPLMHRPIGQIHPDYPNPCTASPWSTTCDFCDLQCYEEEEPGAGHTKGRYTLATKSQVNKVIDFRLCRLSTLSLICRRFVESQLSPDRSTLLTVSRSTLSPNLNMVNFVESA